jgi:hypothetical protein
VRGQRSPQVQSRNILSIALASNEDKGANSECL